jgi:MFS transporter, OFA family, oxalate/formate antiporter
VVQGDQPAQPGVRNSRVIQGTPFFYGWVIMGAGTLGMIMTSPGQTFAISIFIEQFIQDLGISRGLVSTFYMIGTLTGSLALPVIGRMIDRRGPRLVALGISIAFGLACLYMGMVQNALMLLVGFVLVRMLGQGALGLVSTYIINQWWVRRRGTVLGLSGVLMALLGTGGFPNLVNWWIPLFGWRMTYSLLGIGLLVIMAPVAWLFFRDRPEQYGLRPDSRRQVQGEAGDSSVDEEDWTANEARRTPAFWIVCLGLGSMSMLSTGLTFHMVSIFADNQLSAAAAAAVFVPVAITSAIVNLSSGILIDRMPVNIQLAVALVIQALLLWMAQVLTGPVVAALYGVMLGAQMGLNRTVSTVVWPAYFGRRYLGSITGITSTILAGASALGPMPMGIARDLLGSYNLTLTAFSILPLGLAVAALFIRRPQKQG